MGSKALKNATRRVILRINEPKSARWMGFETGRIRRESVRRKMGAGLRALGNSGGEFQEIGEDGFAFLGEDGFGVELDAPDGVVLVADARYLAFGAGIAACHSGRQQGDAG